MSKVYDALQIWRNEDHEDNRVLSRHEIITLLTEIERLRAALLEIAFENPSRPPAECARSALEGQE
jgi:hypothetical protein